MVWTSARHLYAGTDKSSQRLCTFRGKSGGKNIWDPICRTGSSNWYQSELYEIPRQRAQIQIEKKDTETKEKLTGAKFGLYAAEDILAADQKSILVKKDTRLAIAETKEAENGIMDAAFDLDLPMAHYYVREEKAPDGYYRSDTERIFDFEPYKDQDHILSFVWRARSKMRQ